MKKFYYLIFLVSFIYSCSQVPDFSEYQGINYIVSKPFDGGIEINWIRDDPSGTYMDFSPFATAITTGLPAGTTDISRLEVLNLMPDGGFEGGLGSWSPEGAPLPTANIVVGANTIHPLDPANNCLYFDVFASQTIDFDLSNLLDFGIDNANYLIRFNFNGEFEGIPTKFEYHDGINNDSGSLWSPRTTTTWDLGYTEFNSQTGEESLITIKPAPDDDIFSIGSFSETASQKGHIDDVRVVRTDIPLCLRAETPYQAAGRPELISGDYRFSIFIKKEVAADINPDTVPITDANRFPAQILTLCINNKAQTLDITSVPDNEWKKVYTDQFVQIYEGDSITLAISPCDSTGTYKKDAGSILIASPSLTFISE